jgi:hypothetical protein
MLVSIHKTVWSCNLEEHNLNSYHHENLKIQGEVRYTKHDMCTPIPITRLGSQRDTVLEFLMYPVSARAGLVIYKTKD